MSLDRVADRLLGLLTWGKVTASRAIAARLGRVWVRTLGGDDELDHRQPYGFQSRPKVGAEAVVVSMGSSAEDRVVIMVSDRRFTLTLKEGEVALVDDFGQKIHLTREDGIVIDSAGIKLGAGATLGVARETDPVGPGASMAAWITEVSGVTSVAPPEDFGTITSGSAVTRSE